MTDRASFAYLAVDRRGRRLRGALAAASESAAFEQLKRDGLSPLSIRAQRSGEEQGRKAAGVTDRELADFLSDLATLLQAGADIRGALSILSSRAERASVGKLASSIATTISGGGAVDQAFEQMLGARRRFIGALLAAGQAAGDLPGGLQRAAEMLASRVKLRDQMVSVLSYPAFVLVSTVAALLVILIFIVPSLAPLVSDAGSAPPASLRVLIGASDLLRAGAVPILIGLAVLIAATAVAVRLRLLTTALEHMVLDGPARRTVGGVVYGAFAVSLGALLTSGAPMSEALGLAIRSVRSVVAQNRLLPVAANVRQGEDVSVALGRVNGFPSAILRLAVVGESSGALGPMLERAGRMEEARAIRRIEAFGRLLGPLLIVALGGVIALLMAGLLSSVSQLGQAELT